jgi:hypothetical protein
MSVQADKEVFWAVVRDCLEEIFGFEQAEAAARSHNLRDQVDRSSRRPYKDLFYHAEPIDVAGDLAERKGRLSKTDWKRYDDILARHHW